MFSVVPTMESTYWRPFASVTELVEDAALAVARSCMDMSTHSQSRLPDSQLPGKSMRQAFEDDHKHQAQSDDKRYTDMWLMLA
jgi:hypothetical protein